MAKKLGDELAGWIEVLEVRILKLETQVKVQGCQLEVYYHWLSTIDVKIGDIQNPPEKLMEEALRAD